MVKGWYFVIRIYFTHLTIFMLPPWKKCIGLDGNKENYFTLFIDWCFFHILMVLDGSTFGNGKVYGER